MLENPYQSPASPAAANAVPGEPVDPDSFPSDYGLGPTVMIPLGILLGCFAGIGGGAVGAGLLGLVYTISDSELMTHARGGNAVVGITLMGAFMGAFFGFFSGAVVGGALGLLAGVTCAPVRRKFMIAGAAVCGLAGTAVGVLGGAMLSEGTIAAWWFAGGLIGALSGTTSGYLLSLSLSHVCWGRRAG